MAQNMSTGTLGLPHAPHNPSNNKYGGGISQFS